MEANVVQSMVCSTVWYFLNREEDTDLVGVWWRNGFLRIYTVAFDRLNIRSGKGKWLPRCGRAPAGARNRRKTSVKPVTPPNCSEHTVDFCYSFFAVSLDVIITLKSALPVRNNLPLAKYFQFQRFRDFS